MNNTNLNEAQNAQTNVASAGQAERCVSMLWFVFGPPWAIGDYAGHTILAGSEDPNVGIAICDTYDFFDDYDIETARVIAEHIVNLHNNSLKHANAQSNPRSEAESG